MKCQFLDICGNALPDIVIIFFMFNSCQTTKKLNRKLLAAIHSIDESHKSPELHQFIEDFSIKLLHMKLEMNGGSHMNFNHQLITSVSIIMCHQ